MPDIYIYKTSTVARREITIYRPWMVDSVRTNGLPCSNACKCQAHPWFFYHHNSGTNLSIIYIIKSFSIMEHFIHMIAEQIDAIANVFGKNYSQLSDKQREEYNRLVTCREILTESTDSNEFIAHIEEMINSGRKGNKNRIVIRSSNGASLPQDK